MLRTMLNLLFQRPQTLILSIQNQIHVRTATTRRQGSRVEEARSVICKKKARSVSFAGLCLERRFQKAEQPQGWSQKMTV